MVKELRKRLKKAKANPKDLGLLSDDGVVLAEVTEWILSGFSNLDFILGGGWPVRRCVEIFGPEGKGKSALTYMAIKGVQALGGTAMLLDFEAALDLDKMKGYGIDTRRLIYHQPDHIEQAWDLVWAMMAELEANPPVAPFLIIWDSIAGSVPKAELEEKSFDKAHVALIARAMSKACRRMYKAIARVRACMMFVNQIRDQIGKFGIGPQTTTPGGRAVKFAASIRVGIKYTKNIKAGDNTVTGYEVWVSTVKNRLFPPHRKTMWVLDFEYGPSPELTLFHYLKDCSSPKIKSAGKGLYKCKWSETTFKKRGGFIEALKDREFRKGAQAAMRAAVEKDHLKVGGEDEEDEEAEE
jgi:recombination protein RecA